MESTDSSELDRPSLERQISGALDAARRQSRKTVVEMVQRLSPLQPRSAGGTARRQTWYEWQTNPGTVSAVTLLQAGLDGNLAWARMLVEEAEAAYQAPARRGELAGQERRMARVEEDVARLEAEVATLREMVAEQSATNTELRRLVEDAITVSAPLSSRMEAAEQKLGERGRRVENSS